MRNENICGYGMTYYDNYCCLDEIVHDPCYSNSDRVRMCKQLYEMLVKLERYKVAYFDVQTTNVLFDGISDLKLCDMDSVTSKLVDDEYEYRADLSLSYSYLSNTILSLLYGVSEGLIMKRAQSLFQKLENSGTEAEFKNTYPALFEFIRSISYVDGKIKYLDKYIDAFDEEYIKETRRVLHI